MSSCRSPGGTSVMNERLAPLVQLTLWRTREFLREPEAVFWIFAFPILLAFALGLAFKNRGPDMVKIGVVDGPGASALKTAFDSSGGIEALVLDSVEAANRLRTGRVTLLVL